MQSNVPGPTQMNTFFEILRHYGQSQPRKMVRLPLNPQEDPQLALRLAVVRRVDGGAAGEESAHVAVGTGVHNTGKYID